MTQEFNVSGMSCKNCVHHVESAAKAVAGVTKVKVALKEGTLSVQMKEDVSTQIISAVTEAGYPTTIRLK